jgi:hypothetical protein
MARRLRISLILAQVLVLASFSVSPVNAIPFDITHVFMVGECGYLADEVGWWNKTCDGTTSQFGQQSGDWRVSTWYNCVQQTSNTRYYQWCGGAWVEVTQNHFETACSCS